MMNCQKDLFHIDAQLTYLNGAYMSPLLKSVEDAGILGLRKKRMPSNITIYDFFDAVDEVRNLFNQLINGSYQKRTLQIYRPS